MVCCILLMTLALFVALLQIPANPPQSRALKSFGNYHEGVNSTKQRFFKNQPSHLGVVLLFYVRYRSQNAMRLGGQADVNALEGFTQELLCKNGAADGLAHQRGITAREDRDQAVVTPFTDGAMALIEMGGAKKYRVAHKATTIKRSAAQIQIEIRRPLTMPLDGVRSSAGQSQKEGGRFMSRFPYEGHATIRREHV